MFDPTENSSEVLTRRERDFAALQDEIAGRETGRMSRFRVGEADGSLSEKRRGREGRTLSALEMMLLTNPAYAALYERVSETLEMAEAATIEALGEAVDELERTEKELEVARDNASELPDGTKVFRASDGRVYTEDGREVSRQEAEQIRWRDNATTWEEFMARKRAHEEAQETHQAILNYQRDVLDLAKGRLSDPHNPPSMEELEEIDGQIDSEMPDQVRARLTAMQERIGSDLDRPGLFRDSSRTNETHLSAPEISQAFVEARDEVVEGLGSENATRVDHSIPSV